MGLQTGGRWQQHGVAGRWQMRATKQPLDPIYPPSSGSVGTRLMVVPKSKKEISFNYPLERIELALLPVER